MSPTLASSRVVFAIVGTFTDINKEIFAAVWIILRVCDMWHADGGWLLLFPHYWHYSPSPIDHITLSHGRGSCYCPASVTQCPVSSVQCPHCVWCPGAAITGLHMGTLVGGPTPDQGSQGPDTADISFGRDGLVQLPKFSWNIRRSQRNPT